MNKANRSAINTKGFELEAQRIATLMRDQIRLGFVDVGGWDTHVNEGGAQGALANTLDNLGRGLAPYAHALGNQWKNTVVVVSKFGRTFREKRQQGQRPRPRHRVPGARWQHRRRSHRGLASCGRARKVAAGSRLSGTQRLPRAARRFVHTDVGTLAGSLATCVSGGEGEGSRAGLSLHRVSVGTRHDPIATPSLRLVQRLVRT